MDSVEICNVYVRKMIIKAAKRIFNSGKICRSYSDLNIGVTFLEHSIESKLRLRDTPGVKEVILEMLGLVDSAHFKSHY